jgi:hypothetical protein
MAFFLRFLATLVMSPNKCFVMRAQIPRLQLEGLLASFGVAASPAQRLLDAFCDTSSIETEAVVNYTSLCDHVRPEESVA